MAKLISRVEDNLDRQQIMQAVLARTGEQLVTGITGPPGAGKSSLVDALTGLYRQGGYQVGVVAVDPSSPLTGGAILGDRIRMQNHATDRNVFIRSMGTRGYLGGVAAATADVLRILEAGGFGTLLLETVGVGQSEIEIMRLADTVVVVLNPGTGDAIQAIKAGIMEIADIFVVNKSDLPGAERLKNDIEMMLEMTMVHPSSADQPNWRPPVVLTSVYNNKGLDDLKEQIALHQRYLISSGQVHVKRREQLQREVWRHVEQKANQLFDELWHGYVQAGLAKDQADPYALADDIWTKMRGKGRGGQNDRI